MKPELAKAVQIFKLVFSLFLLGAATYFFINNRIELLDSVKVVSKVQPSYLLLALCCMLMHNFAQAKALQQSYLCVNKFLPMPESLRVYLKRFFVSPVIPGGFSVAQYTFASDLHRLKLSTAESAFASSVFVLGSLASFIILLVPTYFVGLWSNNVSERALIASVDIIILGLILTLGTGYLFRKPIISKVKRWLEPYLTDTVFKPIERVIITCLAIDLTGVLILWLSIMAFGLHISLANTLLAYVVAMLVTSLSPFFSGLLVVEGALVYVLTQSGVSGGGAVAAVVVFRFFHFWIPLLIGGLVYIWDLRKHLPPSALSFLTREEVQQPSNHQER